MAINLRLTWDFEFDDSDLNEKFVDIKGLAKDCALSELKSQIKDESVIAEDFEIVGLHGDASNKVDQMIVKAYNSYVTDWLNSRNVSILDVDFKDEDFEIGGEIFACFDEFLDNEFEDEESVRQLLSPEDFEIWKNLPGGTK